MDIQIYVSPQPITPTADSPFRNSAQANLPVGNLYYNIRSIPHDLATFDHFLLKILQWPRATVSALTKKTAQAIAKNAFFSETYIDNIYIKYDAVLTLLSEGC